MEADRDITIDVANDSESDAIVQLEPNGNIDSVFENDDGALEIEFDEATDSSANIDSILTIGDFNDPDSGDEAFILTDNSAVGTEGDDEFEDVELIADLDVTNAEGDADVDVKFDDGAEEVTLSVTGTGDDSQDLLAETTSGGLGDDFGSADVALQIDTGTSDDGATNIQADLIFTVNTDT